MIKLKVRCIHMSLLSVDSAQMQCTVAVCAVIARTPVLIHDREVID